LWWGYFNGQFERWYPSGSKIVPTDVEISKEMLLWWYIGDGCLIRKKSRPNWRRVNLATDSFTPDEVFCLIEKLGVFLGEDDNIYEEKNKIMISRKSLHCFSSLMQDACPIGTYQYKFDFGQYVDKGYWQNSFKTRPLSYINEFRRKNRVRELDFRSKQDIRRVG
jgi:hypothetical protein